jgi:hypothetical protein
MRRAETISLETQKIEQEYMKQQHATHFPADRGF